MNGKIALASIIFLSVMIQSCSESSVSGSPPERVLQVTQRYGSAPLQITYTLKFLESSDYTIKRIEWDLDGNGTSDSTTTPTKTSIDNADSFSLSVTYQNIGVISPVVSIIYNENDAESFAYLDNAYVEIDGRGRVFTDSIYVVE